MINLLTLIGLSRECRSKRIQTQSCDVLSDATFSTRRKEKKGKKGGGMGRKEGGDLRKGRGEGGGMGRDEADGARQEGM